MSYFMVKMALNINPYFSNIVTFQLLDFKLQFTVVCLLKSAADAHHGLKIFWGIMWALRQNVFSVTLQLLTNNCTYMNSTQKNLKTIKITPTCFDLFQIIIRELCFSLLKLYQNIHSLIRFCKYGVVAACHGVGIHCRGCSWLTVRPSLRSIRRTVSQLHSQQCIPTQHDMLPQHHVYRNELKCECYNFSKEKHSSLMMI